MSKTLITEVYNLCIIDANILSCLLTRDIKNMLWNLGLSDWRKSTFYPHCFFVANWDKHQVSSTYQIVIIGFGFHLVKWKIEKMEEGVIGHDLLILHQLKKCQLPSFLYRSHLQCLTALHSKVMKGEYSFQHRMNNNTHLSLLSCQLLGVWTELCLF